MKLWFLPILWANFGRKEMTSRCSWRQKVAVSDLYQSAWVRCRIRRICLLQVFVDEMRLFCRWNYGFGRFHEQISVGWRWKVGGQGGLKNWFPTCILAFSNATDFYEYAPVAVFCRWNAPGLSMELWFWAIISETIRRMEMKSRRSGRP